MAGERNLPGLGLRGFYTPGSDGWDTTVSEDLRMLSAVVQLNVLSRTDSLPTGTDGDIYIVPDGAGANANEIAVKDNGAWVYITAQEGWRAYVLDDNAFVYFDGTDWQAEGTFVDAPIDGVGYVRKDGGWEPESGGGGGGDLNPTYKTLVQPDAGDFTVLNSTTGTGAAGTLTNTTRGMVLKNVPPSTSVDHMTLAEQNMPGGGVDWEMTAFLVYTGPWHNYMSFGLYVKDSATGRIEAFNLGYSGGSAIRKIRNTNINTFSTGEDRFLRREDGAPRPIWLRLARVGSNLHFYISHDGEHFYEARASTSLTGWTATPDKIGIDLISNVQSSETGSFVPINVYVHVMSFEVV